MITIRSTENLLNSEAHTDTGHFHSYNYQKWIPYKFLGGKTVKNVQIDTQTTEISSKNINVRE